MNLTDTPEESVEPSILSQSYINEFSRHQQDVQAHLNGRVAGTLPLPPSYFPPASYWTSAEKDLFFHGLSIYSRLQPDLIAEHVKTKNIFDVCLYLDCLQTGASQVAGSANPAAGGVQQQKQQQEKEMEMEMEEEYMEEEEDGGTPRRNMTAPAMEVSGEWVAHEEAMAARLNALATCPWSLGTDTRQRCLCPGVKPATTRHVVQEGGVGAGSAAAAAAAAAAAPGAEAEAEAEAGTETGAAVEAMQPVSSAKSRKKKKKKTGKEYLAHLDLGALMAVELIIKEEERKQDPTQNLFDVVVPGENTQASQQEQPDAGPSEPSTSRVQAAHGGQKEKQDPADRLAQRRLQKRLYMRRKRAEKTGREVITEAARLRPGRVSTRDKKPKEPENEQANDEEGSAAPEAAPEASVVVDGNASTVPAETQDGGEVESAAAKEAEEERRKGGLTKMYRVKKVLGDNGIDAETLTTMNLDLFHLTTLSKVIKLFKSFDDATEPPDTYSISADTLHLMSKIVVEFVSELIRRAILTKEQEIRLKGDLPIWKYDKYEITGEQLHECLKSMGLDHLNKSNYFVREASRLRTSVPHSTSQPVDSTSPTSSTQFSLPESMRWCCLPAYRELFSSDDLIPEVEDVDMLDQEIQDDREVSLDDLAKSKIYEESLWMDLDEHL